MGKARKVVKNFFRRKVLSDFWTTVLTVLALPSALLTILGSNWTVELTIGLVFGALCFSLLYHQEQLIKAPMPLAAELLLNGHTFIRCPCDSLLANGAKLIAAEAYPPGSIGPERFEQLRVKNPTILACLVDSHENLLGYFDVIPLKEDFARMFLRGSTTEDSITHEDILSTDEVGACRFIFISGLAVRDPTSQSGRVSASILVWGLIRYIEYHYGTHDALVFALASTKAGEELLKRFRFGLRCQPEFRMDGYPLYQLQLAPDAIAVRLECVPDWSSTCGLSWQITPGGARKPRRRRAANPKRKTQDLPPPLAPAPI